MEMKPEQNLPETDTPTFFRTIEFWLRLVGWFTSYCVAPVATFAIKFGLFTKTGYEITYDALGNVVSANKTAINGWGILSCFIIGFFIMRIIKEFIKSYEGYSLTKQILTGIVKTILPIITAFFICYFIRDTIDNIMFCLITIAISQCIAIPLNPLPKLFYEKRKEEKYTDAFSDLISLAKSKLKGGDK